MARTTPASPRKMEDRSRMTESRSLKRRTKGKVAVLVLGMHRSGTSMLAGILDRLGCQGPKTVMPATQWNPKGYFESMEFMKVNDAILTALGTRWDDWRAVDPGWQESPRFVEFRERIAETMASEYGNASLIYLKDPRLCRLLPLLREVLEEIGFTPVCIHTHRNPVDTGRSLEVRESNPVDAGTAMLLWLRHVLDAEAASRGLPRVFTSYAQVLANWTDVSDRAEKTFGFSWPVLRQARDARVHDIVDPGLRHHASSIESLLLDTGVPDAVKDCMKVMERWIGSGEDAAGRETLDRIAERFDASAALFGGPLGDLITKHKQAHGREVKLEGLNRELQERDAERQAELAERQAELAAAQKEREAVEQEREALRARDAERQAELAERQAELAAAQKEREAVEQEREALRAEALAAREELQRTGGRLAQLRAEADHDAAQLREKLAAALAEAEDAGAQLEAGRQQLSALSESNGQLEAALQESRAQSVRNRAEADGKIRTLDAELAVLTDAIIDRDRLAVQLRGDIAAMRRATEERQVELAAARQEREELRAEVKATREELRQANDRLAQLRAEADLGAAELREQLAAALAGAEDAGAQLDAGRKQLSALSESNAQLEAALQDIRARNVQIVAEADGRVRTLEAELTVLTDSIIDRDRLAVQMRGEIAALRKATDEQIDGLKQDRARLEAAAAEQAQALKAERETGDERFREERSAHRDEIERLHREYRTSTS